MRNEHQAENILSESSRHLHQLRGSRVSSEQGNQKHENDDESKSEDYSEIKRDCIILTVSLRLMLVWTEQVKAATLQHTLYEYRPCYSNRPLLCFVKKLNQKQY